MPYKDAAKAKENKKRYYENNKAVFKNKARDYYQNNKEAIKARVKITARKISLKSKYRLTEDQWDQIFNAQGEVCGICKSPTPNCRQGWHTDHDHKTGTVRGILCLQCNAILGAARDNISAVDNLIAYLSRTKSKNALR
jgi:hypothetical protein